MHSEEFYKLLTNPGILDETTLSRLKSLVDEYPFFQAASMLYLKNLKKTGSSDYEKELKKTAIRVPDRKRLYNFLNTSFEKVPEIVHENDAGKHIYRLEQEGESGKNNPLIDKFLNADSGTIRGNRMKESSGTIVDENEILRNSVSENDEMITETLAMLYFKQKNYEKALDAFRKLSLKYPEKSIYFATRIEEIEKLKNI